MPYKTRHQKAQNTQVFSCAFCAFWWLTANTEKGLAILDGLPILNVNFNDLTSCFSLNLVHEFHGFDNAHDRLRLDVAADLHKRVGGRRSRTIERAHNRRRNNV